MLKATSVRKRHMPKGVFESVNLRLAHFSLKMVPLLQNN